MPKEFIIEKIIEIVKILPWWPIVAIISIFLFEDEIRKLLRRIESISKEGIKFTEEMYKMEDFIQRKEVSPEEQSLIKISPQVENEIKNLRIMWNREIRSYYQTLNQTLSGDAVRRSPTIDLQYKMSRTFGFFELICLRVKRYNLSKEHLKNFSRLPDHGNEEDLNMFDFAIEAWAKLGPFVLNHRYNSGNQIYAKDWEAHFNSQHK